MTSNNQQFNPNRITPSSLHPLVYQPHYPGSSDGKESECNAGDLGSSSELGRSPGEGDWLLTPVFLPGESYGQRSLAGYSP